MWKEPDPLPCQEEKSSGEASPGLEGYLHTAAIKRPFLVRNAGGKSKMWSLTCHRIREPKITPRNSTTTSRRSTFPDMNVERAESNVRMLFIILNVNSFHEGWDCCCSYCFCFFAESKHGKWAKEGKCEFHSNIPPGTLNIKDRIKDKKPPSLRKSLMY